MQNNKKLIKKRIKRILGAMTFVGLGLCSFGGHGISGNTVNAQNDQLIDALAPKEDKTDNNAKTNFFDFLDLILKIIYILIWPLLFLAGISLDNSMVYGSFLNMDAPLWQFWNMAKNFANFTLGFMLLIGILKSIFSFEGAGGFDKKDSPLGIIKKALIAGILIQASWFLTSALIDLSTITTYAVGGMPISVMKTVPKFNNKKILLIDSSLDLNNIDKKQEDVLKNSYIINPESGDPIYVSPCKIAKQNGSTFIIGREYGDLKYKNDFKIDVSKTKNICVYNNRVYMFNEFPNTWSTDNHTDYKAALTQNIKILGGYTDDLNDCRFIINLTNPDTPSTDNCQALLKTLHDGNTQIQDEVSKLQKYDMSWVIGSGSYGHLLPTNTNTDGNKEYGSTAGELWFRNTATNTIGNIIDKAQGFVGPLVAIYASLMDFANIADTAQNDGSISKGIGELLIRTGVAIGLVFPLLALCIVLIIRIGFLWMIIAASPLIILNKIFEWDFLKDTISIENIVKTIFAPVITVFALSISLIFMTALSDSFQPIDGNGGILAQEAAEEQLKQNFEEMNITIKSSDNETRTIEIFGQEIKYPKILGTYAGGAGDWFSWMIISFCGIGAMRFILFAAIKASGTIGKKVGQAVQDFGQNVFKTMPIIPAMGGMSIGNITEGAQIPDKILKKYETKQQTDFSERMEAKFGGLAKEGNSKDENMNKYEAENLFNHISSGDTTEINKAIEKGNFSENILINDSTRKQFEAMLKEKQEKGEMSTEQVNKFNENWNNASSGAIARQNAEKTLDEKLLDKEYNSVGELKTILGDDNVKKAIKDNPDYFTGRKYKVKDNNTTKYYKINNSSDLIEIDENGNEMK